MAAGTTSAAPATAAASLLEVDAVPFASASPSTTEPVDWPEKWQNCLRLCVPRDVVGSLINMRGNYIQTLMAATGADIKTSFVATEDACAERIVSIDAQQLPCLQTAAFTLIRRMHNHKRIASCMDFLYPASTPLPVNKSCVTTFNEFKSRQSCKWIIFKVDNDEIVVEKKGEGNAFVLKRKFPSFDCRYAVYDDGKFHRFPITWPHATIRGCVAGGSMPMFSEGWLELKSDCIQLAGPFVYEYTLIRRSTDFLLTWQLVFIVYVCRCYHRPKALLHFLVPRSRSSEKAHALLFFKRSAS